MDTKAKFDGKTAWAKYQYPLSAEYKEKKIESKGLGTLVFER